LPLTKTYAAGISISMFQRINRSGKMFIAGMLTMAVICAIISGFIATSSFVYLPGQQDNSSSSPVVSFDRLTAPLSVYDVSYVRVPYDSTPVYPNTWVSSQFTDEEIAKPQLSGPEIDADGDGLTNRQEYLFATNPKKTDTYCRIQQEQEDSCEPDTDGSRTEKGYHPRTFQLIDFPVEMLLEERFANTPGLLIDSITEAEKNKLSFPMIFAESLSQDTDNWYTEFENELVVLQDEYALLIDEEQAVVRHRHLQFFVETFEAYRNQELQALQEDYQTRLDAITQTEARQEHTRLQSINIAMYSTAQDIINQLSADALSAEQLQQSYIRLFAIVHDFENEYQQLHTNNQLN